MTTRRNESPAPSPGGNLEPAKPVSRLPAAPHPVERTRLTPERMESYLRFLAEGMGKTKAARKARISYRALQDYRRVDPAFKEAELLAEQEWAHDELVPAARQQALNGNTAMTIFLLTNYLKDEYKDMRGQKIDVQVAGKVELDTGPALERIEALYAHLAERAALASGGASGQRTPELGAGIVDAEVLDET